MKVEIKSLDENQLKDKDFALFLEGADGVFILAFKEQEDGAVASSLLNKVSFYDLAKALNLFINKYPELGINLNAISQIEMLKGLRERIEEETSKPSVDAI